MDPMLDQVSRHQRRSGWLDMCAVAVKCGAMAMLAWMLILVIFFAVYGAEQFVSKQ